MRKRGCCGRPVCGDECHRGPARRRQGSARAKRWPPPVALSSRRLTRGCCDWRGLAGDYRRGPVPRSARVRSYKGMAHLGRTPATPPATPCGWKPQAVGHVPATTGPDTAANGGWTCCCAMYVSMNVFRWMSWAPICTPCPPEGPAEFEAATGKEDLGQVAGQVISPVRQSGARPDRRGDPLACCSEGGTGTSRVTSRQGGISMRTILVGSACTCVVAVAAILTGCSSNNAPDHPATDSHGVEAGGRRQGSSRGAGRPLADCHPGRWLVAERGQHAEKGCHGCCTQAAASFCRALSDHDERLRQVRRRSGRWKCRRG